MTLVENPGHLPSVPFAERRNLPHEPGIYFVMQAERVLYVGMSQNIAQRWLVHHKKRELSDLENVTIHWLSVPDVATLPTIENEHISALRPPLNRRFPRVAGALPVRPPRVLPIARHAAPILNPTDTLTPEVRAEMARQGISGAELARRTGHAQQSVSRALLRGPLDPRSLWPDILDALGLELHIRPKTRPGQPSESDTATP